jgi:hypothetical protein
MSDKFDQTIEELIKELKEIKEVLEKGNVIDITKRLKQKRDSDPKTIEHKHIKRVQNKTPVKTVHQEADPDTPVMRGQSHAGLMVREYKKNPDQQAEDKSYGGGAYKEHKEVLNALKRQPKPKLAKDDTEHKIKDCTTCGTAITSKGYIGRTKLPKHLDFDYDLDMYNCPKCKTTASVQVPHGSDSTEKTELIKSLPNGQWSLD